VDPEPDDGADELPLAVGEERPSPDERGGADAKSVSVGRVGGGSASATPLGAATAALTPDASAVATTTGTGRAARRGRGRGLATIATGTDPVTGEPPLRPTGIAAEDVAAAAPSSCVGAGVSDDGADDRLAM
jgi:hypothetical protein